MENKISDLQAKMHQLKINYLEQLRTRIATLQPLLAACEQEVLSQEQRNELRAQAHKIAGTGTTYGFPEISERAKALEENMLDSPDISPKFLIVQIRELLSACEGALKEKPQAPVFGRNAPPPEAPKPAALPILLVVDDDEQIRSTMIELFKDDAHVITGTNSAEALELMRLHKPDLVLLDDMMPGGVSGMRMLEDRDSTPEIKDIPVIMITTSDRPAEVVRGLMAGAADYITKPFNPEEVVSKVRDRLHHLHGAILIADDDEAVRELLKHKFQMAGCKVVCAADGAEAWSLLLKQPFALALLDRMMPGHDGMTLLQMMKESSALMNTPVVFLTARHYGSDVLEGFNTGAADYIVKPFNPDEVVARCIRLIAKRL